MRRRLWFTPRGVTWWMDLPAGALLAWWNPGRPDSFAPLGEGAWTLLTDNAGIGLRS